MTREPRCAYIGAAVPQALVTMLEWSYGALPAIDRVGAFAGLIDGWSVAQAYRSVHPDRPVVYTSTEANRRVRGVAGSLFLHKPFQVREVNRIVRMMAEGLGEYGSTDAPLRAVG